MIQNHDKEYSRKRGFFLLLWVALFSIAMGYLESAVVVYIREIYYPEGFAFPLVVPETDILITEFFREIATLVMLIGIGIVAGRTSIERFALFIYSFGWWDIFYYVFLKALIDWPESLMTWDILFLIPTTWTGPVIAPCINAFTMILLGGVVVIYHAKGAATRFSRLEWMLLSIGSLILIWGYIYDYSVFMMERFSVGTFIFSTSDPGVVEHASSYVPESFNWLLFVIGQVVISFAVLKYYIRLRNSR